MVLCVPLWGYGLLYGDRRLHIGAVERRLLGIEGIGDVFDRCRVGAGLQRAGEVELRQGISGRDKVGFIDHLASIVQHNLELEEARVPLRVAQDEVLLRLTGDELHGRDARATDGSARRLYLGNRGENIAIAEDDAVIHLAEDGVILRLLRARDREQDVPIGDDIPDAKGDADNQNQNEQPQPDDVLFNGDQAIITTADVSRRAVNRALFICSDRFGFSVKIDRVLRVVFHACADLADNFVPTLRVQRLNL